MALEISYPHIEKSENQPARLGRIPACTRRSTRHGSIWRTAGRQMRCADNIPTYDQRKRMLQWPYYFDHQAEIDAEIREELDGADGAHRAAHDSPLRLKLRAQEI